MEEARRAAGSVPRSDTSTTRVPTSESFRVLGRYFDQQKPRDVFFFEQDGAYVIRLLMSTRTGARHVLAEFTARGASSAWSMRAAGWRSA